MKKGSTSIAEFGRRGYKVNIIAQFSTLESVKTAVHGGMGIGILYRARLEREIRAGEVKTIDVPELADIKLKSYVTYSKHRKHNANTQEFLNILRETRDTATASAARVS